MLTRNILIMLSTFNANIDSLRKINRKNKELDVIVDFLIYCKLFLCRRKVHQHQVYLKSVRGQVRNFFTLQCRKHMYTEHLLFISHMLFLK